MKANPFPPCGEDVTRSVTDEGSEPDEARKAKHDSAAKNAKARGGGAPRPSSLRADTLPRKGEGGSIERAGDLD